MKYLEILRAQLAALDVERSAALADMEAAPETAITESRAMNDVETTAFEEARAKVNTIDEQRSTLGDRITELEAIEARTVAAASRPELHIIRKPDVTDVLNDRSATSTQMADAVTRSLEDRVEAPENMAHVRSVLRRHLTDDDEAGQAQAALDWARNLVARTRPEYVRAFGKMMTGRADMLTAEERAALSVGSNTNGGYLLPTHLDPTIILTNSGSSNAIRAVSRVVTLVDGITWNGVTSSGMSASWDGELAEVSDDSPTAGRIAIATNVAQAFAQASIAAFDDIGGLATDLMLMFADAKDRLEGAAHATGLGTGNQPKGVFTAVHAVTNSRVVSTTAATIGEVDIHGVYRTVPVRWRNRGTWVANPLYTLAVKRLGTALSSAYSGDLTQPVTDRILGRPVLESDDAPTAQTTTALDDEILFGDMSQYIVVDKPGSMSVEYIPHLFNTANNLPDGRRGWFAYWRTGADISTGAAFAVLVDKTSA